MECWSRKDEEEGIDQKEAKENKETMYSDAVVI
jgi:hypothetical protein